MQLPLVRWFITYLSVAAFAWSYWGLFIDWALDNFFESEDEVLWYLGLLIVAVISLITVIGVYR